MYLTLPLLSYLKEKEMLLRIIYISGIFQEYKGSVQLESGNTLVFLYILHYLWHNLTNIFSNTLPFFRGKPYED